MRNQQSTIFALRSGGLSDRFQSSDLLVNLFRHGSEVGILFVVDLLMDLFKRCPQLISGRVDFFPIFLRHTRIPGYLR